MRVQDFFTSSVTDGALLGSYVGATVSQDWFGSVPEWPHGGTYFARRFGASYTGGVARGVVELSVGAALHTDPRHVSCSEDPIVLAEIEYHGKPDPCLGVRGQLIARPWHVVLDSITLRTSSKDGLHEDKYIVDGVLDSNCPDPQNVDYGTRKDPCHVRRWPAIQRFVGIYANAYSASPWYPAPETTSKAVSIRAAMNFGFTFAGSFWTEYGSSITTRASQLFHRTPTLRECPPGKHSPPACVLALTPPASSASPEVR